VPTLDAGGDEDYHYDDGRENEMDDITRMDELQLVDLDIEALDISEFLDETRLEESQIITKLMAASCTTCECCCSCCCS
jgi:thiazolylpeptide-type bacteriocin precursor